MFSTVSYFDVMASFICVNSCLVTTLPLTALKMSLNTDRPTDWPANVAV